MTRFLAYCILLYYILSPSSDRYSGADWCVPVQAFFALPSATRGLTGNEMRARDPDASCPEMTWKLSIEKAQYWYKTKPGEFVCCVLYLFCATTMTEFSNVMHVRQISR